jgi:uncharacterized protein YecT (DUF1311 family)
MRNLIFSGAVVVALMPGAALADWIDPGIAYRCDEQRGEFSAMAIMETSSPELNGEVRARAGYTVLSKKEETTELSCRLNGSVVSLVVWRIAPRESGRCAAFNHFNIKRLQVNGVTLVEHEMFNGGCHSDPTLYEFSVRVQGESVLFKTCRGVWSWDAGYSNGTCKEDAIAQSSVQAPSFDCFKAKSKLEKLICSDSELSQLDAAMARKYQAVLQNMAQSAEIRRTQKLWIIERNQCAVAACVKRVYETRLEELTSNIP